MTISIFICGVHGLVEQLEVDPVWRVLETSCIEKQDLLCFLVVASDRAEVSFTSLSKSLSTEIADRLESFDLRCRYDCSLEQVEIM